MFSESLRRQLELLNRSARSPTALSQPSNDVIQCDRNNSGTPDCVVQNLPLPQAMAMVPLPGHETFHSDACHLTIQQPLRDTWTLAHEVIEKSQRNWPANRHTGLRNPTPKDRLLAELTAFYQAFPQRVLFLDLETCGLAGSTIFLVGLLAMQDDSWQCIQLWARNYGEEKAILQSLWKIASEHDVLVTFNGKSFDWPQIHSRSTIHKLGRDPSLPRIADQGSPDKSPHGASSAMDESLQKPSLECEILSESSQRPHLVQLDLLHHARRIWKSQFLNCRLQTLERNLCGRVRFDDIPGRHIPSAYHQYVQTGDTREVRRVLHHNTLDLLTLFQITLRVMEIVDFSQYETHQRRAS